MEKITEYTGLSAEEIKKEIKDILVESVLNNTDIEIVKRRSIILNAMYDLV